MRVSVNITHAQLYVVFSKQIFSNGKKKREVQSWEVCCAGVIPHSFMSLIFVTVYIAKDTWNSKSTNNYTLIKVDYNSAP